MRNIIMNGTTNVTLNALAASDSSGLVPLYIDQKTARTTSMMEDIRAPKDFEPGARTSIIVPSETLDSVLAETPVDFIKIDVEGAEMAVLSGARSTLEKNQPVVIVEVLSVNLTEATNFFASLSYSVFDARDQLPLRPHDYSGNLLALPALATR
jgi:FkbM family methyltransferase